jgi:hypothetical protein
MVSRTHDGLERFKIINSEMSGILNHFLKSSEVVNIYRTMILITARTIPELSSQLLILMTRLIKTLQLILLI